MKCIKLIFCSNNELSNAKSVIEYLDRAKKPFLVELQDFHFIDRKNLNCANKIMYRPKDSTN